MKLRRFLGAFAAASVAISAVSVSASALTTKGYLSDGVVYLRSEEGKGTLNWLDDSGVSVADVYGVTFHVMFASDESTWTGGGIGANSPSTGWKQTEWDNQGGKPISANLNNGTITWLNDSPVFSESDKYMQFWLATWDGAGTIKITSADVLGKDGVVLSVDAPVATTAPAETTAPEETTTPEETTAPAEETEPTIEVDETVDATVDVTAEATTDAAEADLADYFDGNTVYLVRDDGGEGYIDVTGDDITEIYGVKFNVTFDDDEVANDEVWVGGGVGANSNSTGWEQHEWGKESGMKEITPDFENGTITWYKGSPIFTADEEYAQLWIQSWGGSLTVDSVELLYADYEDNTTADAATADAADDTNTDANKGNPDTGVAGVAVAAGVVALAGAAVVVSRKRK